MRRGKRENEFPDNGFEAWGGYMNAKISKLEEQFLEKAAAEIEQISNIFSGISIFVNGYTKPSAGELKRLMAEHGGTYHHYFRSKRTSYIIASNLPDTKVKHLPTTKILKPDWVSESIKAGTLLDYKDYLLYSNHSKTQPRLNFRNSSNVTSNSSCISVMSEKTPITTSTEYSFVENFADDLKSNLDKIDTPEVKENLVDNVEHPFHEKNHCQLSKNSDDVKINKSKDRSSTRTAADPRFLSEFYNNSRLHHISQLGAAFKQYVNELRNTSDQKFPLRETFKQCIPEEVMSICDVTQFSNSKIIMHIDMDCFFVSVGLRKHPQLRGQPVAVTHAKNTGGAGRTNIREGVNTKAEIDLYRQKQKNKNRKRENLANHEMNIVPSRLEAFTDEDYGSFSEIASCSYEARALGLHNGMFMGPALKLCPQLKTIPYDFDDYKEVAYVLYDTIAQYTLNIEAVSCDEMYVDCTDLLKDLKLSAADFATKIRNEIKRKTGCPCSTGFGGNRLQARLATKKAKPNGQFYLYKDSVDVYFENIQLSTLPGVGRQMQHKLSSLGYTTCGSLRLATLNELQKHLGHKTGTLLYQYCRGKDDKPLSFTTVRKSISAGVNYGIRFENNLQCDIFLKQLCVEVCSRMSENNVTGKSITLKLMVRAENAPVETAKFMGHGFCDNITKTSNLASSTDNIDVITKEVLEICKKFNVKSEDMRGISIQISKLENCSVHIEENKGGIKTFFNKEVQEKIMVTSNSEKNESADDSNLHKDNSQKIQSSSTVLSNNTSEFKISPSNDTFTHSREAKLENTGNKIEIKTVSSSTKPIKSLGLTGKRRGRPPKHLSVTNKSVSRDRNNSLDMFIHINKHQNESCYTEDLDQDFLNALPDDLKAEVLANYKTTKRQGKTNDIVQNKARHRNDIPAAMLEVDPEYLAALPEDMRKEIETNIVKYTTSCISPVKNKQVSEKLVVNTVEVKIENQDEKNDSDILSMNWKEMREMMRHWFEFGSTPMASDIEMVQKYVQNLVTAKNIENLHYLLNFFYRYMTETSNCSWHLAYLKILDSVQEVMLIIYQKKLSAQVVFSCCNPRFSN